MTKQPPVAQSTGNLAEAIVASGLVKNVRIVQSSQPNPSNYNNINDSAIAEQNGLINHYNPSNQVKKRSFTSLDYGLAPCLRNQNQVKLSPIEHIYVDRQSNHPLPKLKPQGPPPRTEIPTNDISFLYDGRAKKDTSKEVTNEQLLNTFGPNDSITFPRVLYATSTLAKPQVASRANYENLKALLDHLMSKIDADGSDIDKISAQREAYNTIMSELVRQGAYECAEKGDILNSMRAFMNETTEQIPALSNELQKIKESSLCQITALQSENKELEQKNELLNSRNASLENDLKEVETQLQFLQEKIPQLEEETKLYRLKTDVYEKRLSQATDELEKIKNEKLKLKMEMNEQSVLAEELSNELRQRKESKFLTKDTINKLTEENSNLKAQNRDLKNQFNELNLLMEETNKKLDSATETINRRGAMKNQGTQVQFFGQKNRNNENNAVYKNPKRYRRTEYSDSETESSGSYEEKVVKPKKKKEVQTEKSEDQYYDYDYENEELSEDSHPINNKSHEEKDNNKSTNHQRQSPNKEIRNLSSVNSKSKSSFTITYSSDDEIRSSTNSEMQSKSVPTSDANQSDDSNQNVYEDAQETNQNQQDKPNPKVNNQSDTPKMNQTESDNPKVNNQSVTQKANKQLENERVNNQSNTQKLNQNQLDEANQKINQNQSNNQTITQNQSDEVNQNINQSQSNKQTMNQNQSNKVNPKINQSQSTKQIINQNKLDEVNPKINQSQSAKQNLAFDSTKQRIQKARTPTSHSSTNKKTGKVVKSKTTDSLNRNQTEESTQSNSSISQNQSETVQEEIPSTLTQSQEKVNEISANNESNTDNQNPKKEIKSRSAKTTKKEEKVELNENDKTENDVNIEKVQDETINDVVQNGQDVNNQNEEEQQLETSPEEELNNNEEENGNEQQISENNENEEIENNKDEENDNNNNEEIESNEDKEIENNENEEIENNEDEEIENNEDEEIQQSTENENKETVEDENEYESSQRSSDIENDENIRQSSEHRQRTSSAIKNNNDNNEINEDDTTIENVSHNEIIDDQNEVDDTDEIDNNNEVDTNEVDTNEVDDQNNFDEANENQIENENKGEGEKHSRRKKRPKQEQEPVLYTATKTRRKKNKPHKEKKKPEIKSIDEIKKLKNDFEFCKEMLGDISLAQFDKLREKILISNDRFLPTVENFIIAQDGTFDITKKVTQSSKESMKLFVHALMNRVMSRALYTSSFAQRGIQSTEIEDDANKVAKIIKVDIETLTLPYELHRDAFRDNFTRLLDPTYSNRPPRTFEWIMKSLKSIYDEKTLKDVNDAKNSGRIKPISMPLFTLQWSMRQYGLDYLAHQCCWDLVNTARAHESKSDEIETFRRFLDEDLSTQQLAFFLRMRAICLRRGIALPVESITNHETGEVTVYNRVFLTTAAAIELVQKLFQKAGQTVVDSCVRAVRADSVRKPSATVDQSVTYVSMISLLNNAVNAFQDYEINELKKLMNLYTIYPRPDGKAFKELIKELIPASSDQSISELYRIMLSSPKIENGGTYQKKQISKSQFIGKFDDHSLLSKKNIPETLEIESVFSSTPEYEMAKSKWKGLTPLFDNALEAAQNKEKSLVLSHDVQTLRLQIENVNSSFICYDIFGAYKNILACLLHYQELLWTLNTPDAEEMNETTNALMEVLQI